MITYTEGEQEVIRRAPTITQRNKGSNFHDHTGRKFTGQNDGFVVEAPVGGTVSANNNKVWRAVNRETGAVILVVLYGTKLWRIRFSHWIQESEQILYTTWSCMLKRCYEPTNASYPSYGGKGIIVDVYEWRPGGRHTYNGTAEERRAAFNAFRLHAADTWRARYRHTDTPWPCRNADGLSPEFSRMNDEGNYDRTTVLLSWSDHLKAARACREATAELEEGVEKMHERYGA